MNGLRGEESNEKWFDGEISSYIMDIALLCKSLNVARHVFVKYKQDICTSSVRDFIINTYPMDYIEQIKILCIEIEMTKAWI